MNNEKQRPSIIINYVDKSVSVYCTEELFNNFIQLTKMDFGDENMLFLIFKIWKQVKSYLQSKSKEIEHNEKKNTTA